jgi:hypothetical protein
MWFHLDNLFVRSTIISMTSFLGAYGAYNSLVIFQPLLKPIETIAVIVLSEQLK